VSVAESSPALDAFDASYAHGAPDALRPFNEAGVVSAADVHVAMRLTRLMGIEDEEVMLAAAFAVRAPRLGHVCTDLAALQASVSVDVDVPVNLAKLPWPDVDTWIARLAASPMVAVGDGPPHDRPLRLIGAWLYLDRYWREERQVADDLRARSEAGVEGVDRDLLAGGLARLFPEQGSELQRLAAACTVLRRLAVVSGGPGTGKTTTVARILALLDEQAGAVASSPPLVALAAPTGKAAARLEEAVRAEAARLDVSDATRARLLATGASTLHRLLGWRPGSRSRFRYHRGNRLPHDIVVVDETSMVSLSLMARLLEAVRGGARLVLVGDAEQLASVEAGAVLGDIVGPASDGLVMSAPARALLAQVTGEQVAAAEPPRDVPIGDGIVVLRRLHRFGGRIADLAEAVRVGDDTAALDVLGAGHDDVRWLSVDVAAPDAEATLVPVREAVVAAGRRIVEAARAGDGRAALDALGAFRLLCAHRHGVHGVAAWMERIEAWLAESLGGFAAEGSWYLGRPLLMTQNDYGLRLYNGDTGVVVAGEARRPVAVFERGGEIVQLSPTRLEAVETVHAMTIHKSQGSQFDDVAVILPDPTSPILTRELLYTAVTRARRRVILAGTEAAIRAALARPIARASGLRGRLWGE
jgi:exodeoxyribonuclease V alpha subunit